MHNFMIMDRSTMTHSIRIKETSAYEASMYIDLGLAE